MKIGILTLPLHTNYGGILQAYALQTILERMGHEVKVFNKEHVLKHISWLDNIRMNIVNFIACLRQRSSFHYVNQNNKFKEDYCLFQQKTCYTRLFVEKYINTCDVRNYSHDMIQSDIDVVVVGSDQIWSPFHGGCIDGNVVNAFLPQLPIKIKRISYAASFGHDSWKYSRLRTIRAKKAIKKFDAVSVREVSGIKLCHDYLDTKAEQHLDPTMLLTKDDYINNINIKSVAKSPGNMLVYVIDSSEEKDKIVSFVEHSIQLRSFRVNSRAEDINLNDNCTDDIVQPPVEQWLRGFYDAEFIVTDSFHACVFSILFQKPFVVIANKKRGMARFQSLLDEFGIRERLVCSLEEVKHLDLHTQIDYARVDSILDMERHRSIKYLKSHLV